MDDLSAWQVYAITTVAKLAWAIIALYAAVRFSGWLDARAGNVFKEAFDFIRQSRVATALYLAARWIGICYVIGQQFS